MKRRLQLRNALTVIILAFATALTLFIVSNFKGNSPEEVLEGLPKNVDLSLKQIQYTETRDGRRSWSLVADSAAHNLGEGSARIDNIRMTFFDDKLGDLRLQADHGTLATEAREVSAFGQVKVSNPRGYAFFTDKLTYRETDRMIRSDDVVRIESPAIQISGRGLRLNVDKRSLVVLSDVRAEIPRGLKGVGR